MIAVNPIFIAENIQFSWPGEPEPVIDIESLVGERRERVFLRGPSGSVKTTLLSLLGTITKPQSGELEVDSVNLQILKGSHCDKFRADHIGLIFQQFKLLPFQHWRCRLLSLTVPVTWRLWNTRIMHSMCWTFWNPQARRSNERRREMAILRASGARPAHALHTLTSIRAPKGIKAAQSNPSTEPFSCSRFLADLAGEERKTD